MQTVWANVHVHVERVCASASPGHRPGCHFRPGPTANDVERQALGAVFRKFLLPTQQGRLSQVPSSGVNFFLFFFRSQLLRKFLLPESISSFSFSLTTLTTTSGKLHQPKKEEAASAEELHSFHFVRLERALWSLSPRRHAMRVGRSPYEVANPLQGSQNENRNLSYPSP